MNFGSPVVTKNTPGAPMEPQCGCHWDPKAGCHWDPKAGCHLDPKGECHWDPKAGCHWDPRAGPQGPPKNAARPSRVIFLIFNWKIDFSFFYFLMSYIKIQKIMKKYIIT